MLPAVIVMVAVPWPLVIVVPAGTVHVYEVHPNPVKVYDWVLPAHIERGPVMVPPEEEEF